MREEQELLGSCSSMGYVYRLEVFDASEVNLLLCFSSYRPLFPELHLLHFGSASTSELFAAERSSFFQPALLAVGNGSKSMKDAMSLPTSPSSFCGLFSLLKKIVTTCLVKGNSYRISLNQCFGRVHLRHIFQTQR